MGFIIFMIVIAVIGIVGWLFITCNSPLSDSKDCIKIKENNKWAAHREQVAKEREVRNQEEADWATYFEATDKYRPKVKPLPTTTKNCVYISYGESYGFLIAGYQFKQDNLIELAGPKVKERKYIECLATLRWDKFNEHDSNAVMVRIDGKPVGYLPKKQASKFEQALGKIGLDRNIVTVHVKATIQNGYKHDKHSDLAYHYEVLLDLPPSISDLHTCFSLNSIFNAHEVFMKIPLSKEQKKFFKYFNLKIPADVFSNNFIKYRDEQLEKIKIEDNLKYLKWVEEQKLSYLMKEIQDFWLDCDELELYNLKRPTKANINKTIEILVGSGLSLQEIYDRPDDFYNQLIKVSPNLIL